MKKSIIKIIRHLLISLRRYCDQLSDRMNQWSVRTRKLVLVMTMLLLSTVLLVHLVYSIVRVKQLRQDGSKMLPDWEKIEDQVNMKERVETITAPLDSQQMQTLDWLYETSRQMEEEEMQ